MLRPYTEADSAFLEENDRLMSLELKFHGGVLKNSALTSVGADGKINGAAYLKYHYSWNGANETLHRLVPSVCADDEEIYLELITRETEWVRENAELTANKRPAVAVWRDSADLDGLRGLVGRGFLEYGVTPVLGIDLTSGAPEYPVPDGFRIERLEITPENAKKYIAATGDANDGTPDCEADVLFGAGDLSYKIFVLMCGDKIASSATTWRITDERAAIENIFTTPEFRRRGCARAVISHTLREIEKSGYGEATLTMLGGNRRAARLYASLGFRLRENLIELDYII